MTPEASLWAVVLAGGVGSRFWPVSRPARPKQLLPLAGDRPLITETVERIRSLVPLTRLRILAGAEIWPAIQAAVPGLDRENAWLEPSARGTAPVLTWAAHTIAREDPEAVMISLHSDHVIEPAVALHAALNAAAGLARREQRLFTLGATPTRAEPGYGYIAAGAPLGPDAFEVRQFVEKPDAVTAARFIAEGYLWNTGIFVLPVGLFLDQVRQHTPELAGLLPLLDGGEVDEFFARAPTLSVDEGVLERTGRIGVLRTSFRWDDVGAWDAVLRMRETDEAGNAVVGDAYAIDASGSVLWSEDGAIVAWGVEDLVIVRSGGTTFVAPLARAAELKRLLERLPDHLVRGPEHD